MCQATVLLGGEVVGRDVIWLEPEDGGVSFGTLFDERHFVAGRIRRLDFLKHRVELGPLEVEDERK